MSDATLDLLRTHLQVAVPLFILEFLQGRRQLNFSRPDLVQTLAQHGDHVLYRGEHTAQAINALCEAIATIAFCPGGVAAFGLHFHVPPELQASRDVDLGQLLSFVQEMRAVSLESTGSQAAPGCQGAFIQVPLFNDV